MYIALRKIYTLCKFYVYVYDACVINKVLIYMVDDTSPAVSILLVSSVVGLNVNVRYN